MINWQAFWQYALIFFAIITPTGIAVWAVKAYLNKRTDRVKAGEQYLTQEEIKKAISNAMPDCDKEHGKLKEAVITEIKHVKQLIEKDLEKGSEKFVEQGEELKVLEAAVSDMNTSVCLLVKEVQRQNNWDKKTERRKARK